MEFSKHHVSPQPGEPVLLREISVFARSNCRKCLGTGTETFVSTSRVIIEGKRKSSVDSRNEVPCRCALQRFHDKFANDVAIQGNGLRWKELDVRQTEV